MRFINTNLRKLRNVNHNISKSDSLLVDRSFQLSKFLTKNIIEERNKAYEIKIDVQFNSLLCQ